MKDFPKTGICTVFLAGGALLAATVLAGCGGSDAVPTGASSPTTVTVKHAKDQPAPSGAAPAGNESAAAPAGAAAGGFGTFRGKVVFQGTPPKLDPLFAQGSAMKKDDSICVKDSAIPNEKLIVGEGNGVANVYVFISKAPGGVAVPPPTHETVIFDQHNCRFMPHALVTRTGQEMKVLNSDPLLHNTHTHASRNQDFNLPIPGPNKTGIDFQYKLPEAQPVEVTCDIHSWMRAYHLPLDHPWAAVTGKNGEFEIKNVPSGAQKFQVWHEAASGRFLSRNLMVTIKPGEVTTQEIPYDASKLEL